MGELRGPAGIVVLGDSIALVVERDNGRVQGFHLPDFTSVGTFGDRLIGRPNSITAYLTGNAYAVYIAYDTDAEFARVAQFRLTVGKGELIAIHWRTFGDTTGTAVLHSSEGISVDAGHNRLLITDRVGESAIRVYDVDGHFTGRVISGGAAAAGGIGFYACNNSDGYWVTTERRDSVNRFQILDRESLVRVGAFAATAAQPGRMLTVSPRAYATFLTGVVFVARKDGSLAAISWRDIAAALQLRPDCNSG
jgi:3-phytase